MDALRALEHDAVRREHQAPPVRAPDVGRDVLRRAPVVVARPVRRGPVADDVVDPARREEDVLLVHLDPAGERAAVLGDGLEELLVVELDRDAGDERLRVDPLERALGRDERDAVAVAPDVQRRRRGEVRELREPRSAD
jgi:hypothetical protein